MPADKSNFGLFACLNGKPAVGSTDPYGGDIDTTSPLAMDGTTPNLLISPEPANANGGADILRFGAGALLNTHASASIEAVFAYIRNAARQPVADGAITITPSFTVPAGKKVRIVYRKTDNTPFAEFVNFNGANAINTSVQCKAGTFVRLQITDSAGNPEDFIPINQYMTISRGITMGLLRGKAAVDETGDTMLTAENRIGFHTAKNESQEPANRTTAPTGVTLSNGLYIVGTIDSRIWVPDDGILAGGATLGGDWCQLFQEITRFNGAEPPLGSGAQVRPRIRFGGNAA